MDTDERDAAEFAIWGSVVAQRGAVLPPDVAEFLLTLEFPDRDVARMHDLAAKARAGGLTPGEAVEAEAYGRVGSILSILHSKARTALKSLGSKRVKLG